MILLGVTTSTTDTVWCDWNTTTTALTTASTWVEWSGSWWASSTAVTCTTTTTTWASWNYGYIVTSPTPAVTWEIECERPVTLTPEQAAAAEARVREAQEAREREAVEQVRVAAEAEVRAEALLRRNLSAQQEAEFNQNQTFTVISRDGERRYRIRKGWSHNVERIDAAGKKLHTLCAHPVQQVPHFDNMLAQKLLIEHDEEHFLQTANVGAR